MKVRSSKFKVQNYLSALLVVAAAGCGGSPAKTYPLTGQVLAVNADKQELTIKHDDIPNFMPAMTMSYRVTSPALLKDRAPGELISATLAVQDALGQLTAITHVGSAPLPSANELAMAEGVLGIGGQVTDVALIDQSDRRRSLGEWKGHDVLLTFIYTRCPLPDFCPLMDQNFSAIQKALSQDAALGARVRLISVTLDPEHDTAAVLGAHAAKRKANPALWTFLTGDRGTVDKLAGQLGVGIMRDAATGGITHNLRTVHLDGNLRVVKVYSGNEWTPSEVLADLRKP